jgi:hypothetical protein
VLRLHRAKSLSLPALPPPPPPGSRAPPVGEVRIHLLRQRPANHLRLHHLLFPSRRGLHHDVAVAEEVDADGHVPDGGRHRVPGLGDGEGHEWGLGDDEAVQGRGEEGGGQRGARCPLECGEGGEGCGARGGRGWEAAPEAVQAAEAVEGAEEAAGSGGGGGWEEQRARLRDAEVEREGERERRGGRRGGEAAA